MSAALERLIEDGHRLLAEERAILTAGRFDAISRITQAKQALLAELEPEVEHCRPTAALRLALERLIEESRRNERLIEAARAGLAAARRRIEAIVATRLGAVAYDKDGSVITSTADRQRDANRA